MQHRAKDKKKGKDSDEEEVIELADDKKPQQTAQELQELALADVPTIPESEMSPAAYIFQQSDDRDDLGIYEAK